MSNIKFGGANEIPLVEESCPIHVFENNIRKIGVVAACEWFGHESDSDFTKETIAILLERSGVEIEPTEEEKWEAKQEANDEYDSVIWAGNQ